MGQRWLAAVVLSGEDAQSSNMPAIFGCAYAFSLVASAMLAWILSAFPQLGSLGKMAVCVGIASGFIVLELGTNYLFSHKSRQWFLIDGTYRLLFYLAMGGVHSYGR